MATVSALLDITTLHTIRRRSMRARPPASSREPNRAHFCRITVDRQAVALLSITKGYRPFADSRGSACCFVGQSLPCRHRR
jgi:hypothetical protein